MLFCSAWIMFLLFLFGILILSSVAQRPTYRYHVCTYTRNYTANSAFPANLNLTLASLQSNATRSNGFYSTSTGQSLDRANGLFLCRGDISPELCQSCVKVASDDITNRCSRQKEAIIWYHLCMLRYSNEYIFSDMEETPTVYLWTTNNTLIEPSLFNAALRALMNHLVAQAVSSSNLFATGEVNVTFLTRAYGLVQCTPDITSSDCKICLERSVRQIPICCNLKQGGSVYSPSCNIRFEANNLFYNMASAPPPSPPANDTSRPPPPTSSNSGDSRRSRLWIVVGTAVSAVIAVLLFGSLVWCWWRRNRRDKEKSRHGNDFLSDILRREKQVESQELPLFSLGLTLEATQHFSDENKLGEGGFGPVYKGILVDGKEIAVKRLSRTSGQGLREFKNEVTLIAKLQHKNLVRLLGCCLEGNELLLIYEFMPNKSLDFLLFDSTRSLQLDWKTRLNIINGISRGLLYLHEDSRLRIIHRDMKASNVLLDHDMNPKISDFGMAKIFGGNQTEANTNRVVGTYGYMAPEYAMEGLFSVKSDVFSFGVLLLEILSGRKNNGFHLSEPGLSLLNYTWKLWCEGQTLKLMDPVIIQSCDPVELFRCIHIGLLCVQEDPIDRPTMSSVVVMLASDSILPQPTQPAFSVGRVLARLAQPSQDVMVCSVNEVTLSNVSPR